MSDEESKAELERLRNENAALKKGASSGILMKVSEKGVVSIYGMGCFPVYKEQWLNARFDPGQKISALQPFPTGLTFMRYPLYSTIIMA